MVAGALRNFILINVAIPLAWAASRLVEALAAPMRDGLMSSLAARGSTLGDAKADARWWLRHYRDGAHV